MMEVERKEVKVADGCAVSLTVFGLDSLSSLHVIAPLFNRNFEPLHSAAQ
jgi:hypothetical protein